MQSGERILFATDAETGTIEAHVMITYSGDADDFAWVVPVVSLPELDVGSNEAFVQLELATMPYFTVAWSEQGSCDYGYYYGEDDLDGAPEAAGGGVKVAYRGEVGPYDAAVLDSDSASALLDWLREHDYHLTDAMEEIIQTYVDQDQLFVALRLLSDQSVGDIQPIVLRFEEGSPCIPLRLTAIAAVSDMPVRAWVLGEARSIPQNYLHVQINWAAIDWLNYGCNADYTYCGIGYNYPEIVAQAADEAGGNAFTTEYAGTTDVMDARLWWDDRYQVDALRALDDPGEFMNALIGQGWPASGQLLAVLRRHMPLPEALVEDGVSEQSFYNCVECYEEYIDYTFDAVATADELEATIAAPMEAAQALFDAHAYLTRLTTFISPEEMTIDPIFAQNADLPDVSNVHAAQATLVCGAGGAWGQSAIVVTLPDGRQVVVLPSEYGGYEWPTGEPAAAVVEQLEAEGFGKVLVDNVGEPAEASLIPPEDFEDEAESESDGGCSVGGARGAAPLPSALMLLALGWLRARRRRATR
ncbi:MAG: DUF2330 domain-containing protein [Myxococcota bacterium]